MFITDLSPATKKAISVDPRLQEDRYLQIRPDLSPSKETLHAEFEAILNKYHNRTSTSPIIYSRIGVSKVLIQTKLLPQLHLKTLSPIFNRDGKFDQEQSSATGAMI